MPKRVFSAVMFILLVTSMLTLALNIKSVKASGTIYIRADGSIDPPDAPISTFDNVTYTLTGNVMSDVDGIIVEMDNIVVDGAGCTIQGTGASYSKGISHSGRSNVTIKNLQIQRFFTGIYANSSNYDSIHGNNITENGYGGGIALEYSLNNVIYGNNITDIQGGGILLGWASGNNVSCNNIMTNMTNDGVGIGIASSSNNILSGNNIITNYRGGIYLGNSSDNSIAANNIAENNGTGVWLDFYSSNNIVSGNAITKNGGHGIMNGQSSNITILENNIRNNNQSGVLLGTSSYLSYTVVSGNNITNNKDGISLAVLDYCNNFISENNIADNSETGIQIIPLHGSPKNILYHNNFVSNTLHINFTGAISSIKWDNGYPFGGNYWSDYTGIDADGDGLGDTSYIIDAYNQDRYPLMRPWSSLSVHNMNTGLGYAAIQAAINANETLDGHTIFVETGTYYENVVVNKSISLIGENREATIIDGGGKGTVVKVFESNNTLKGFSIQNTRMGYYDSGIYLYNYSGHNIFAENKILNCYQGIFLWESSGSNIIEGNVLTNNSFGIVTYETDSDVIMSNNVTSNGEGIWISGGTNISIVRNNITDNNSHGIRIDTGNNMINHNNIISNTIQAEVNTFAPVPNVWDDGYPSGGNFWSDYDGVDMFSGPYQNMTGRDGVGDTPYVIDADNIDHYPLVRTRSVGVKVGDWAKYDLEVNYSTNDPHPPIIPTPGLTEWKRLILTVLSVEETNITYEQTVQFQNGSEYSISQWIDVDSGQSNNGPLYTGLLVAANLTAGDHVYSPYTPTIDSTITRYYCGMQRGVNFLSDNLGYGESEYFWDRASGIIAEMRAEEEATHGEYRTYLFLHLIMSDTNIWRESALLGDVNGDSKVDMKDVMVAVQAFNSFRGYPRWNANADLDDSGRVDMRDLVIIVLNFNKHQ